MRLRVPGRRGVMAGAAQLPEEVLAGGNFNHVVRVGDTVRRGKTGAWTQAIHALLRHLERAGFDGAPRPLGVDDKGREVLTFVAGEPLRWASEAFGLDSTVERAGRLLRRFHDAAESFIAPADARWQDSWFDDAAAHGISVAAPIAADVVCHNDVAPHNTVVAGGVPVALIDWDFARPAPRAWDVAYGMASFAPLPSRDVALPSRGAALPVSVRGGRMRRFCEGYGLITPEDRRGLLDVAELQLQSLFTTLKTRAAEGDPFCAAAWERTNGGEPTLADIAYLRRERAVLLSALDTL